MKFLRRLKKQGIESVNHLPYEKYLRSMLWIEIRTWVVESQGDKCAICSRKAKEVHHHEYDEATMLEIGRAHV